MYTRGFYLMYNISVKVILLSLFIFAVVGDSLPAEEAVPAEVTAVPVPGKFTIVKVNRVKKESVLPPDQRNFLGSRGLQKFDYGRLLRADERGENYIVTLRYRGEELTAPVRLNFFYRLQKEQEKMYLAEYIWPIMKSGSYGWTLENLGARYLKKGKVDRWRVVVEHNGQEMIEKRSATWRAMEGEGREYSEDELVVERIE